MSDFYSNLNEQQKKAVLHEEGPLLIVAGAGSGKTRVITCRIAHLINKVNVSPYNILAVTFTNKAASEMKSRLNGLIGPLASGVSMGTFHSVSYAILRRFKSAANLSDHFSVVDQEDRKKIISEILKAHSTNKEAKEYKKFLSFVSGYKNTLDYVKNKGIREYIFDNFPFDNKYDQFFSFYQQTLNDQQLIDFDDMLPLTLRLFENNSDILEYYKKKWQYILVDEYQDTNDIQVEFLRTLVEGHNNICAVGDDDQAIYSWRGANVANMLNFSTHFLGTSEVTLEQNYRSSEEILLLANKVISNNTLRKSKALFSASSKKGEINECSLKTETAEANYVTRRVKQLIDRGVPKSDIAVLYRTNSQSRNFEVALQRSGIKFKVFGGVGFYSRKEIKDIISYLRFTYNPRDFNSFLRSIKTPPRSLGDAFIEKVTSHARENGLDLIKSCNDFMPILNKKQQSSLSNFLDIIENAKKLTKTSEMLFYIIEKTAYISYLNETETQQYSISKASNLEELISASKVFEEENPDSAPEDFLGEASLLSSVDESDQDAVLLMTVHSAKGLEFEAVILTGLEETIFPLKSANDINLLEEERRLFYVGLTRAKSFLEMTHVQERMLYGKRTLMNPSQFLQELEDNEENSSEISYEIDKLKKGSKVIHASFGIGNIISIENDGSLQKAMVMFEKHGVKKLVTSFLKKI